MKIEFRDIEDAYMMANTGGYGACTSLVDKVSGQFYYQPENSEDAIIPADVMDSATVVALPDKKDFDLGSPLVFRFVRERFPDGYDKVSEIFTRRGAYGRYKKWLKAHDLLVQWDDYSSKAEESALREWCAKNGIELETPEAV
ncbi:MAG: hypothetical protein V5783_02640 [Pontiella sp.]